MEQVGYAVSKTAGVFHELAGRLQDGQNYADIAKAESVMEQARADHAMAAATLPPEQRMKLWETDFRPKVEKQISEMRLSPYASQRVMPQWSTFDAKTRTNITYDAYKDKVADQRAVGLNRANELFNSGDIVGAASHLAEMERLQIISKGEELSFKENFEKKNQDNQIADWTSLDPDGLIQAVEDGKFNLSSVDQLRAIAGAKQQKRVNVSDASDALDDMVLAGNVPDREFIQKYGEENGLSVRQILSHVNSFEKITENTPEGQAKAMDSRSKIFTAIAEYDPTVDTEFKRYGEISMMIRALPEGLREDLRSELQQKKKDGVSPDNEVNKGVFDAIDSLSKNGGLGNRRKHPKDEKDDPALSVAVSRKEATLKSDFRKWRKTNPKATIEQSYEWLNGMVKPDVVKNIKVQANFPRNEPPNQKVSDIP